MSTLYREPTLEEIVEKLKVAKSTGKLYNFTLSEGDKPGKAVGQVMGFLRQWREGKPIREGTLWLMRQIEAGINAGAGLIDWDETLEMWNGKIDKGDVDSEPMIETREQMFAEFR